MNVLCSVQLDNDEVVLIRQKMFEIRESWYKRNEEEVTKRWAFEEAVSY